MEQIERSEVIKPPVPCPVCGTESENRIWSYFLRDLVHIDSPKHIFVGSSVTPLICTVCGYVQLFVNPEDFRA